MCDLAVWAEKGMAEPLIELRHVSLSYGNQMVLRNVNVCVRAGDFFGLVGPNGSGKTTLLRVLLGMLRPRVGEILRALPPHAGDFCICWRR